MKMKRFVGKISVNANIFTGHRETYALLTRRPGSDTHCSLLELNDSLGFVYLKTNDEKFEKVRLFGETRGLFKRDSIESIETQIFTTSLPSNRFLCNVEIPESRQGAPKKHVESRKERNDRSMERQRASPCPGHKSRPFFALEGPTWLNLIIIVSFTPTPSNVLVRRSPTLWHVPRPLVHTLILPCIAYMCIPRRECAWPMYWCVRASTRKCKSRANRIVFAANSTFPPRQGRWRGYFQHFARGSDTCAPPAGVWMATSPRGSQSARETSQSKISIRIDGGHSLTLTRVSTGRHSDGRRSYKIALARRCRRICRIPVREISRVGSFPSFASS